MERDKGRTAAQHQPEVHADEDEGAGATGRGQQVGSGRKRAAAAGLIVVLVVASPAAAAVVLAMGISELVQASTAVIVGSVLSRKSQWSGDRIVTLSRIAVDEAIVATEGSVGPVITVVTAGGEVGDIGLWVAGEARMKVEGRYLLFARRSGCTYRIAGRSQGCLEVVTDEEGASWVMPPDPSGLVTWKGGLLVPAMPFLEQTARLEDVVSAILDTCPAGSP